MSRNLDDLPDPHKLAVMALFGRMSTEELEEQRKSSARRSIIRSTVWPCAQCGHGTTEVFCSTCVSAELARRAKRETEYP